MKLTKDQSKDISFVRKTIKEHKYQINSLIKMMLKDLKIEQPSIAAEDVKDYLIGSINKNELKSLLEQNIYGN